MVRGLSPGTNAALPGLAASSAIPAHSPSSRRRVIPRICTGPLPREARPDGCHYTPMGSESEHLGEVMDHHLVGAAADGDEPCGHERPARGALLHVAEAPVQLNAGAGAVPGRAAA